MVNINIIKYEDNLKQECKVYNFDVRNTDHEVAKDNNANRDEPVPGVQGCLQELGS